MTSEQVRAMWKALFPDAPIPSIESQLCHVAGIPFRVVRDSVELPRPPAVLKSNLASLDAHPRPKTFPERFVLTPKEGFAQFLHWEPYEQFYLDCLTWSKLLDHVATQSTYLSGGSTPQKLHLQSFPLAIPGPDAAPIFLTALHIDAIKSCLEPLVDFGEMPHFESLRIEKLGVPYPAPGLRLTYESPDGPELVVRKVLEIVLGYDHNKAFNLVIVPRQHLTKDGREEPAVFLFPRRRSGRATFLLGDRRYQIAGLEMNGLLFAQSDSEFAALTDPSLIRGIFANIAPSDDDVNHFFELIESY